MILIDRDERERDDEPTGSCERCGCNLYGDEEVMGVCDSCEWYESYGATRSNEHVLDGE